MENKRKNYKKPTVEKVEVQWNKCIAGSPTSTNATLKVDPAAKNETQIWFGAANTNWNNDGF